MPGRMRPGRILYSRERASPFTSAAGITQRSSRSTDLLCRQLLRDASATVVGASRSQRFATVYIQASALYVRSTAVARLRSPDTLPQKSGTAGLPNDCIAPGPVSL